MQCGLPTLVVVAFVLCPFLSADALADESPRTFAVPDDEQIVGVEIGPPRAYSRNGRRAKGAGFAHLGSGESLPLVVVRVRSPRRGRDLFRLREASRNATRFRCRFRVDHENPEFARDVRIRTTDLRRHGALWFPDPDLPPTRKRWSRLIVAFASRRTTGSSSGSYVGDLAIEPNGHLAVIGGTTVRTDLEVWSDAARWDITPTGDVTSTHLGPLEAGTGITTPRVLSSDGRFAAGWANLQSLSDTGRAVPLATFGAATYRSGMIWDRQGEALALAERLCDGPWRVDNVIGLTRAGRLEDLFALVETVSCFYGDRSSQVWSMGGHLVPLDGQTSLGAAGVRAVGISEDGARVGGQALVVGPGSFFADLPVWWDEDRTLHELVLEPGWRLFVHDLSPDGRWLAGFIADDTTGRHVVWDIEAPDAPPTVLGTQDWNPSTHGLNGNRLQVGRDGTVIDTTDGRIWQPGWADWRSFRSWLDDEHGHDVTDWPRLFPSELASDDAGIAFTGRGDHGDGTSQLFAVFIPRQP